MRVLGIESSCDETAAAVVEDGRVLSDVVASQVEIHGPYGGVVPELASRNHMGKIVPVVGAALDAAGISVADLDGIAATAGPGLVGALLVGLQTAKALAFARRLPFVGVNHLRGHLLAARIEGDGERPDFPYMALLASGGHTGVYLVEDERRISCLGGTRDDAAGEAYDKVGKLLGLGYPGGPVIDRLAEDEGDEVDLPQALRQRRSYEFSFSGLKTAVAQHVAARGGRLDEGETRALARGFQRAVVEILVRKLVLAARERQVPRIVLAGGVAANRGLRRHAADAAADKGLTLFVPPASRCTDNGAMIAYAGYLSLAAFETSPMDLAPRADWPL
ncbi:MAG: tRNA (adenosine(37)-N6)-threonylcarbamoyltransferase complex transferase subunit TsaD [Deltaproteobacteria bacterium]|nr:tRNA (adenosine(37)-N6)-threonylcarbamoyltransferase complex transferase subunit TsaD [Deltaproteobacteria bacterium]